MGKCRTLSCSQSRNRARRNKSIILVATVILGSLFIGTVFLATPPLPPGFTYVIGNENWECSTSLYAGSAGGLTPFVIPGQVNTATLPSYVMGTPTSSALEINPDYAPGTVNVYVGGADYVTCNATGPLSQVVMSLSEVVPCGNTGSPTTSPVAAKEWDDTTGATPIHWYQYYFYFEVEMKTLAVMDNEAIGTMKSGDWATNSRPTEIYQHTATTVEPYISVNLQSIYQNASFRSNLADARVISVQSGYDAAGVTTSSFQTGDYPANVYNYYDINNALNPTYPTHTGNSSTSAVLDLGTNVLQPGILFNWGSGTSQNYGIKEPVNVFLIYGVLFSVQVTRPLTQSNRSATSAFIQIYDYLIAVIQDPSNPMFWVILLGIAVVLFLVFGRKKNRQAAQNFFFGSAAAAQPSGGSSH